MADTVNVGVAILISAGGVAASCGVAYGLVKATLKGLKEAVTELKTDVKEEFAGVKADIKEVRGEVKTLGGEVNECKRNIALVSQELAFRAGAGLKTR